MPFGIGPSDLREIPLEQYKASTGQYLGAVVDEAWASNPVPSLLRWVQRQRADFAAGPISPYGLEHGTADPNVPAPDASRWLTKEEAQFRGQEYGLKLDRPMSEETLQSIIDERRRQIANAVVYDRARREQGYGPGHAALSLLTDFAVSAVDPINLASAFIPVTRIPGLAGLVARVPAAGGLRYLARGGIEGAAGQALAELPVAAAALDENPNYGFTTALTDVAFGTALGGGLHWLGGRMLERLRPAEPARAPAPAPSPRDILAGEAPAAAPAEAAAQRAAALVAEPAPEAPRARPEPPQEMAARIEQLSPEMRRALYETALRQGANDLSTDVAPLAPADRAWRPLRAGDEGERYRLAANSLDYNQIRRELDDLRSIAEHLQLARAADPGQRLQAPPDFQPTPAQLKAAADYVKGPPRGPAEPISLAQFVRAEGGIDIGQRGAGAGELRQMDLGRSGLLRQPKFKGLTLTERTAGHAIDDMALRAWEAGFFPGSERPTIDTFLQALIADAQGQKTYPAHLQTKATEHARTAAERTKFDDWMASHPLGDPRDMDARTRAYWLSLDPLERRLAELDDLQARGIISAEEAADRAWHIDRALAAEQEAATREMLDAGARPEGFEKDLEGARTPSEDAPVSEAEHYAIGERSGLPEAPGGGLPEGAGRSQPAGGGPERGAPGAVSQPGAAAAAGEIPRAGGESAQAQALRAEAALTLREPFDPAAFEAWIKKQADWTADAHADVAASAKADAVLVAREAVTPERDLAELAKTVGPLLDEASKQELAALDASYGEAKKIVEAFSVCKNGGAQ